MFIPESRVPTDKIVRYKNPTPHKCIFSGQAAEIKYYGITKGKTKNKKRSLKIIRLKRHSHETHEKNL